VKRYDRSLDKELDTVLRQFKLICKSIVTGISDKNENVEPQENVNNVNNVLKYKRNVV